MPKGYEDYKNDKKKPKLSLKEKRLRKRERKMKDQVDNHPDLGI